MIKGGFYIMAREIDDSVLAKSPPHVREIYHYLIRKAEISPSTVGHVNILRGQLLTSYDTIREDLKWRIGARLERYTQSQIKKAMAQLREKELICTQRTTMGVIVEVRNYSFYQDASNYSSKEPRKNREGTATEPTMEPAKEPEQFFESVENTDKNNDSGFTKEPMKEPATEPRKNRERTAKELSIYKEERIKELKNLDTPLNPPWGEFLKLISKNQNLLLLDTLITPKQLEDILQNYEWDDFAERIETLNNFAKLNNYKNLNLLIRTHLKKYHLQKESAAIVEPMWKAYKEFHKHETGMDPDQSKVAKAKLLPIFNALKDFSNTKDAEGALNSWNYILKNWDKLDKFYQNRIKINQIHGDLSNIVRQIKQNGSKKTTEGNTRTGKDSAGKKNFG